MSQTYDLYSLQQTTPEEPTKYFGLSVAVHVGLAIASLFVVVPALEKANKELITIELEQTAPPQPILPLAKPLELKGEKNLPTKGAQARVSPKPAATPDAQLASSIKGRAPKSKSSHFKTASIKTHTGRGHMATAKTAVSRAGIPETLEDIAAPDLDTDSVAVAQLGQLGDHEFENEFKKVDKSNAAAIRAEKSSFDEEAQRIADEKEASLQSLEEDNLAQAKAMEDAAQATRTKNAATLAQVRAAEQAAIEKAARAAELAAAQAEARRNQALAAAAAGRGQGLQGKNQSALQNAGSPNGVRSLDQFKQLPGNPKPQYTVDERLRREQGQIVFYAFITSQGLPNQFKLVQSTGYKNLDDKTLAALKKWKFYPGQQGWVEIPFKWDLKGGVQEMPTLLRRLSSR